MYGFFSSLNKPKPSEEFLKRDLTEGVDLSNLASMTAAEEKADQKGISRREALKKIGGVVVGGALVKTLLEFDEQDKRIEAERLAEKNKANQKVSTANQEEIVDKEDATELDEPIETTKTVYTIKNTPLVDEKKSGSAVDPKMNLKV